MNYVTRVVCIMGLSIALANCGGVPEPNATNCSGRGMESSLTAYKNNEAARQAFIDKCTEINKENAKTNN